MCLQSFLLLIFAVLSLQPQDLQPQDEDIAKQDQAVKQCSIFSATIANASAWRSGDVLVRTATLLDTVNEGTEGELDLEGVVVKCVTLDRLIFDFDKNLFCWLTKSVTTHVDLTLNEGQPYEIVVARGLCVSGDKSPVIVRDFPSESWKQPNQLNELGQAAFLKSLNIPDFRGTGIVGSDSGSFQRAQDSVSSIKTGVTFISRKDVGNYAKICLGGPVDQESRRQVFDDFTFDLRTLMPLTHSYWCMVPDDVTGAMVKYRGVESKNSWQELNNIFLPTTIRITQGNAVSVNGTQHIGIQEVDCDFHWFSINEPVDQLDVFKGSPLKDFEAFFSFVDPKLAGASGLIERSSTSK